LHVPEVWEGETELDRCIRYWVAWNLLIETRSQQEGFHYVRYRLDDLGSDLLMNLLELIGSPQPQEGVDRVLTLTSSTTNSQGPTVPLTSEEVAGRPEGRALMQLASRYGYEL
jgi:hypothetical protein